MKMIIGGAFQGKTAFVKKKYPEVKWVDGKTADINDVFSAEGILDFNEFISRELKADNDISELAKKLINENPDVIIVSNEIGYGVVPMDAFDRKYRETVGRICTKLAFFSSQVTRVVCGIGTVIKDA